MHIGMRENKGRNEGNFFVSGSNINFSGRDWHEILLTNTFTNCEQLFENSSFFHSRIGIPSDVMTTSTKGLHLY